MPCPRHPAAAKRTSPPTSRKTTSTRASWASPPAKAFTNTRATSAPPLAAAGPFPVDFECWQADPHRPREQQHCSLPGPATARQKKTPGAHAPGVCHSRDEQGSGGDVGGNLDRNHLVGIADRLAALDLVDIVHAFNDLAPDSVLLVEERGVAEADEELRIGAVRALGAGHRGGAALIRLIAEFLLQIGVFRATGAAAVGAAGLGHEALDHAVKHDAVVKAFPYQLLDVLDMVWRQVRPHGDNHFALGGFNDEGVFGIRIFSHVSATFGWKFVARM